MRNPVEENSQVLSRGTFKLKPYQSPKAIDIEVSESRVGSKGMMSLGIYQLDDDFLAWCWGELGSTDRPKDFIPHADHPRHHLMTFQREKP
jgi:uncharacterized protein (TIGR03067 family)